MNALQKQVLEVTAMLVSRVLEDYSTTQVPPCHRIELEQAVKCLQSVLAFKPA